MTADETWNKNTTHVLRNRVVVPNGKTLSITAGAVVKFCEDTQILVESGGKLVVTGSEGEPVQITRSIPFRENIATDGSADEALREKYAPVEEGLTVGRELALLLKARAKQRGELEIDTTELRFVLDERGVCVDVSERERGEAEELI